MKKISVAIATFNEEKNIERLLESVVSWTDEIVVVDGSSTDKTVETVKRYKTKIIITDNPSIFHINKQKAIDACTSDWTLQLDADEVVTAELRKEIINVVTKKPKNQRAEELINGYWLPRKNFFFGKFLMKGGQYPDYTLRLYRRGKGKLPCKSVHEQAEVEGKSAYLRNPLLHFPYSDFSEYLEHFNRYTDIFAQEYRQQKFNISPISFINYFFIKPISWFLLSFIRHKGFMDGFPGFIFSFFSSLRFPVSYIKYLKNK